MTQDEIIEMARQAGCPMANMMPMYFTDTQLLVMLEAFAKLVAEKEREACAKYVEEYETDNDITATWLNIIADAIRARRQA
jgi:hypothetical protein